MNISACQDLAMGTDAEGERIKDQMRNITPILLDQTVNNLDKLRIIALYVLSKNGIQDADLNRLVHHAQISTDDKQTIVNMAQLGVNVVVEASQLQKSKSLTSEYFLSFLFENHTKKNFTLCFPIIVTVNQISCNLYVKRERETRSRDNA